MSTHKLELDADAGHLRVEVNDDSVFLQMHSNDIERPDFIHLSRAEWESISRFVAEKGAHQP